jgi:sporulation protein YlmC with PRC-barrel domain
MKEKLGWRRIGLGGGCLAAALLVMGMFWLSEISEAKGEAKNSNEGTWRASWIIDHSVLNGQGQELGEVDDLIMRKNGRIKKAILAVGGFLGIGDKDVAVAFRSLRMEKGEVSYSATKDQLEKYPRFSYREEGLYGHYYFCYRPYALGALPAYPHGEYQRHYPPRPYLVPPPQEREIFPEREMMRVSPILGTMVLNYEGIQIGKVDDLLIDAGNDKAERVILSVTRDLDLGDKRVSLPFKNLEISYWGIFYDIGREQLKTLPNFSY